MTRILLALAVPAVLSTPLATQHVVPPLYGNVESLYQSMLPFGVNAAVRAQFLYGSGVLPSTAVHSISLRGNGGLSHPGLTNVELEIGLSNTTVSPWSMNASFAANRGADYQIAFRRRVVNLPPLSATPVPAQFNIRFPMDTPLALRAGSNLLVEWVVYRGGVGAIYSVDATGPGSARHTTSGNTCGVSHIPTMAEVRGPNSILEYSISAPGYANGTAVHVFGTQLLPTPVPLPFGGCLLYQDILVNPAHPIDAAGRATARYPLPDWAKGVQLQTQVLATDPGITSIGSSWSMRTTIGGFDAVSGSYSRAFSHTTGVVRAGGAVVMKIN